MPIVLEKLAHEVIGEERDTLSRCGKLVNWIYEEFEWSSTDYQYRTVSDILA